MLIDKNGDALNIGDAISIRNSSTGALEDARVESIFDKSTGAIWITMLNVQPPTDPLTITYAHEVIRRTVSIRTKEITCSKSGAVNDHVCPRCKNDRVNKTEVSCWRCGETL